MVYILLKTGEASLLNLYNPPANASILSSTEEKSDNSSATEEYSFRYLKQIYKVSRKIGTITSPRQINTRHDKPQTDKHQTRQILDIINIRHNMIQNITCVCYVQRLLSLMLILSRVCRVQCLSVQGRLQFCSHKNNYYFFIFFYFKIFMWLKNLEKTTYEMKI